MSHLPKNICIRIMAEYGSSGVWEFIKDSDQSGWRHSMTTHERLGLSRELSARFKSWIETYENENISGELDHVSFNATGLSLAYEVYEQLGGENYVEFQGEGEDGNLEEPITIRQ